MCYFFRALAIIRLVDIATQSFLIAGANGLSVSLWEVADESTPKFMIAMYELVSKNGYDYAQAMTEVKRRFIRGDFGEKYKAPFYWAAFVYYGVSESNGPQAKFITEENMRVNEAQDNNRKLLYIIIGVLIVLGSLIIFYKRFNKNK